MTPSTVVVCFTRCYLNLKTTWNTTRFYSFLRQKLCLSCRRRVDGSLQQGSEPSTRRLHAVYTYTPAACRLPGRVPRCSVSASYETYGLAVTAFAARRIDVCHRRRFRDKISKGYNLFYLGQISEEKCRTRNETIPDIELMLQVDQLFPGRSSGHAFRWVSAIKRRKERTEHLQ